MYLSIFLFLYFYIFLLIGFSVLLDGIAKMLVAEANADPTVMIPIIEFANQFAKYFSSVSVGNTALLAFLKMERVSRNEHHLKKVVNMYCISIWLAIFSIYGAEFMVYYSGSYSMDSYQYRRLMFCIPAITTILIATYSFTKIYFTLRGSRLRLLESRRGHPSGSGATNHHTERRFITVTALQLTAFVAFIFPQFIIGSIDVFAQADYSLQYRNSRIISLCHPIFNSMSYFMVYHGSCCCKCDNKQSNPRQIEPDIEMADLGSSAKRNNLEMPLPVRRSSVNEMPPWLVDDTCTHNNDVETLHLTPTSDPGCSLSRSDVIERTECLLAVKEKRSVSY